MKTVQGISCSHLARHLWILTLSLILLPVVAGADVTTQSASSESQEVTLPSDGDTSTPSTSTPSTTMPSSTTTTRAPPDNTLMMTIVKLGIPETGPGCAEEEEKATRCLEEFLSQSSMYNSDGTPLWPEGTFPAQVHSGTNLTEYCSRHSAMKKCLKDQQEKDCSTDSSIQYLEDRVVDPADYTCDEGRHGFQSRQSCVSADVMDECADEHDISEVVKTSASLIPQPSKEYDRYKACQDVKAFLKCAVSEMFASCPRADGYSEVVQQMWLQPLMQQIDCTVFLPGQCQRPRFEECIDPFLAQDSFYTTDNKTKESVSIFLHGTYPAAIHSDTVMLDYCRHYTVMRNCLHTVRYLCEEEGKSVSYTVDQIEVPAEHICMEAFHTFIDHKSCLTPEITRYCSVKYEMFQAYDSAVLIAEGDGSVDQSKKVCSLIKDFLDCHYQILSGSCSGLAGDMDDVQRLWLTPLMDEISCSLTEGMSAAEIAAIVLGLLFALALLFAICGNFAARRPSRRY